MGHLGDSRREFIILPVKDHSKYHKVKLYPKYEF
jgi:hypothetical protein